MDNFERLLRENQTAVERFVKFKLSSEFDAEDVLQEVYLSASLGFDRLADESSFKAWLLGIARNKCADFYRKKARQLEIPIAELDESALSRGRMGVTESTVVRETLDALADRDKEILWLYFFKNLPQAEIAYRLGLPLGTVKSRLYNAKQRFKEKYPYPPKPKGVNIMKMPPQFLPAYTITKSDSAPFSVVWEELMGWFLVPKLGERLTWGMYDMPERRLAECDEMEVIGKAEIHGIEGVEITVKTHNPMDSNSIGGQTEVSRRFVAQLTETHCRYLAENHREDGVNRFFTFLDGDSFLNNWGFGENNRGNETHLSVKGDIVRDGNDVKSADKPFLLDIVGRYTVTIGGVSFDTVCVMDIETYNPGVVSEQYLDKNGLTVLWRRFNRDDWAFDRYRQRWSERLPENERLTVNGETYIHWYDCVTDRVF